jgi:hypothetical protein
LVGFLLPEAVTKAIHSELVVDKEQPDKTSYQHWVYNNYDDAAPYYKEWTFYNLTNLDAVLNGSKPHFQPVGPYVYRYYTKLNDVEFLDNGNQVSYKDSYEYHYQADMSGEGLDPLTDQVTIINLAYFPVLLETGNEQGLYFSVLAEIIVSNDDDCG